MLMLRLLKGFWVFSVVAFLFIGFWNLSGMMEVKVGMGTEEIEEIEASSQHRAIDICDVNGCEEVAVEKFQLGCLYSRVIALCEEHAGEMASLVSSYKSEVIDFLIGTDFTE